MAWSGVPVDGFGSMLLSIVSGKCEVYCHDTPAIPRLYAHSNSTIVRIPRSLPVHSRPPPESWLTLHSTSSEDRPCCIAFAVGAGVFMTGVLAAWMEACMRFPGPRDVYVCLPQARAQMHPGVHR